jgi:dUTP pyrophosphatase
MVWIKAKKLHPDARMPTRATPNSSGYDISCVHDLRLLPNHPEVVKTGWAFEIPQGYEIQVRPRSGLAAKHGITVVNSPGTIDADFRGEVGVILRSPIGIDIPAGTRIAQLVVQHVPEIIFQEVEELTQTERGEGGYGSTGT